jgi:hypothetical protein
MEQLDLIAQRIYPKYPRPAKFSDPGSDFSDEELVNLIGKNDADLIETDLMCIFQGALPAGVYHEVMYFLPIALQHIAENKESDTANELLRWMSYYREDLQADGCYDDLLNFFETLFAELTSEYILSENYVKNSNLCETLAEILNKNHNGMGDVLIKKYLGKVKNSVQAGWLLHFLEYYYIGILKDSEYLSSVAQDKDLRQKIYDFIIAEALNADGNTMQFWEHKLNYCGFY